MYSAVFIGLERARSTDGSGLGLSLVAAIVELHGAKIKLATMRRGFVWK